jgi:hypothetical protein
MSCLNYFLSKLQTTVKIIFRSYIVGFRLLPDLHVLNCCNGSLGYQIFMICRYCKTYTITRNKRGSGFAKELSFQGIYNYTLLVRQYMKRLLINSHVPAESIFENCNKYSKTSKNHIKITT